MYDFPLKVKLGEKVPTWDVSRWKGNNGLRFIPPDDEGFTLRGDRRRLVYKGRRRSHRFTVLGDTAFEYDCILEREPESNVITLLMEGAEQFDFFRQPDFISDPFLKGSYAVYKKETLIGEGTGKLCHIHRPEIIDARGRRCWGDLSISGDRLCITIPEQWLAEAKYPVVVDPTIGTTTVGSQIKGPDPNNKYYDRPWLDNEYTVNRYQVPQNGNGICTAYVYCYHEDTESWATPFIYNNVNNKPYKKITKKEKEINVGLSNPTAVWKNNTFEIDGSIIAGEYVWFGILASWFTTRFDYGGECYKGWFDYEEYEEYEGEPPPYMSISPWDSYCTIKWSMYFNYTAITSQNFVRTLTQGVSLTDLRKLKADYKRDAKQKVQVNTFAKGMQTLYRRLQEAIYGLDKKTAPILFTRFASENVNSCDTLGLCAEYFRGFKDIATSECEGKLGAVLSHKITDTVQAAGLLFRGLIIVVKIITTSFIRDFVLRRFLKAKSELEIKSCITREIVLESRII